MSMVDQPAPATSPAAPADPIAEARDRALRAHGEAQASWAHLASLLPDGPERTRAFATAQAIRRALPLHSVR